MRLGTLIFVVLVLAMPLALAKDISISPGKIQLDLLRDGYAERDVKFRTTSEEAFNVVLDWGDTDMEGWVTVLHEDGQEFEMGEPQLISATRPLNIKVVVTPEDDAPNGLYSGIIYARSDFSKEQQITGSTIQLAVAFQLFVNITDEEVTKCRAVIDGIENIEVGDRAVLPVRVYNDGNVRISPKISVDVWDYEKRIKQTSVIFDSVQVLPTTNNRILVQIPTQSLPSGQYFVDVNVEECNRKEELAFDILAQGEVSSEGKLITIHGPFKTVVGDSIAYNVEFENTGNRAYPAYFSGALWLDDVVQDVLRSEELTVQPGEIVNFTVYTKSKEVGLHYMKGNVYFDKKRTFEQEITLKSFPEDMRDELGLPEKSSSNTYIMIGLGVIILILLVLVIKKRVMK